MNAITKVSAETAERPTGLALMRVPFPPNQISKLPKPTKNQTIALNAAMDKKDFSLGIRCKLCGQWHHKDAIHLDYVGHAALTDRLLECDPEWNWEPLSRNDDGTPKLDQFGGMWINLTVCGVTRMGYGHADGKSGGDAVKETIGDALRNAAMRFGAALDLWHKGDLHAATDEPEHDDAPDTDAVQHAVSAMENADTLDALAAIWKGLPLDVQTNPKALKAKDTRKADLTPQEQKQPAIADDEIPY